MITRLDKNRLNAEKEVMLDELAEESRLENIPARKIASIRKLIYEKHDECIEALQDDDADVDEVIKVYRGLIHKVLKH